MESTNTPANVSVDEVFNDSYERCVKNCDFIGRFQEIFVASCEVVAQTIADTNKPGQLGIIEAPLYKIMALRTVSPEDAALHFRKIGVEHGHTHQDIAPGYHDLWEKCLLETVAEYDDQYDSNVKNAWVEVLAGGIKVMKSLG
jgi:hemoglobin-like flavoprotein